MYLAGNIENPAYLLGALPTEFMRSDRALRNGTIKSAVAAVCTPKENFIPKFYAKLPLATNVSGLYAQDWQTARMAGLPQVGNLPYTGAVSADEYLRIALLNSDWQKVYDWYAYQISSIQATGRRAATYFYGLATLDLGQHKYTVDSCGHRTYYPFSLEDVCGFVTYVKIKTGVWDEGAGPALFGMPDTTAPLIPPLTAADFKGAGVTGSNYDRVNKLNGFLKYCTSKTTGDDWRHEFGEIFNNLNAPGRSTPYPGLAIGWLAPAKSNILKTVLTIVAIAVAVWFTAGALMAAYGPAGAAAGAAGATGTGAGASVAAGVAAADTLAPIVLSTGLATSAATVGAGLETILVTGAAASSISAGTIAAITAAGAGGVAVATALQAPTPMTTAGTPTQPTQPPARTPSPPDLSPPGQPLEEIIVRAAPAGVSSVIPVSEILTSIPLLVSIPAMQPVNYPAQSALDKAKTVADQTNKVLSTTNDLLTTAGTIQAVIAPKPKPPNINAGNAALVAPVLAGGSSTLLIVAGIVLAVMLSSRGGK